ncbi:MAG: hypothetical protein K9L28_09180 [Synergistales bacterium]|nr:hypothetical protein [Synergistales bacterium]
MTARERIAYLRGLLDGVEGLGETENRLFTAVTESLEAIAAEMGDQAERLDIQEEHYEGLYDSLTELEEDLEMIHDEVDNLIDEDEIFAQGEPEEAFEELEESFEPMTCTHCGHVFYYNPGEYEEGEPLQCPACGAHVLVVENNDTE